MTDFLREYTQKTGFALLSKDYAAVNDLLFEVHLEPFHGYTRVPKLVMDVIATYGDSMFFNQANIFFQLANQIAPTVKDVIYLNKEYFVYNELMSGEVYKDLEFMLDFLMTEKHGLYLSHKAIPQVLLKHENLDLQYGVIPTQQEAKQYMLNTLNIDVAGKVVAIAVKRFDELSSSMYYDYIYNLRHALLHCTAFDIFKEMPKAIVDYVKTIKFKDDVCVQWLYDLLEILSDNSTKPIYHNYEEELIARAYKELPPLTLTFIENGEAVDHTFNIPVDVAYRLSLVTFHPILQGWFELIKLM